RHVRAEHRIDLPHRRVPDRDPFDEHIATAVRLYELRPEERVHTESARTHRDALLRHLEQPGPRRALVALPLLPAVVRIAVPFPPVLVAGLAVERARAGHGDVHRIPSVDEGRQAHHLRTL